MRKAFLPFAFLIVACSGISYIWQIEHQKIGLTTITQKSDSHFNVVSKTGTISVSDLDLDGNINLTTDIQIPDDFQTSYPTGLTTNAFLSRPQIPKKETYQVWALLTPTKAGLGIFQLTNC